MKTLISAGLGIGVSWAAQAARFTPMPVNGSLNQPVFAISEPGTANLWVVEKVGRLKRVGSTVQTLLDVSTQSGFTTAGEQGLLGLAVDLDFSNNGFAYFYESSTNGSASGGPASLIVRYQYDQNSLRFQPASRNVLYRIAQESFSNHKGGMIAFGSDGHLYVATGDGGSGGDPHGNSQNKASLLGKILRFKVVEGQIDIPASNPFVGEAGSRGEIWAYGMRNPWRFSFDRLTGDLWAGDVGQGRFEEIDVIVRGGNYGWNIKEGPEDYENPNNVNPVDYVAPVYSYGRNFGSATVGGYVYRGERLKDLKGQYIFGDYGSAKVWSLKNGAATQIGSVQGLVSFAETRSGELLAISIMGQIFQIDP